MGKDRIEDEGTIGFEFKKEDPSDVPNLISERARIFFQRGMSFPLMHSSELYCEVFFVAEDAVVVRMKGKDVVLPSTATGQNQEVAIGDNLRMSFSYPFLRLVPVNGPGKATAFKAASLLPIQEDQLGALHGVIDASGIRRDHTVEPVRRGSSPTIVAEAPRRLDTVFDAQEVYEYVHDPKGPVQDLAIADETGKIFWRATLSGPTIHLDNGTKIREMTAGDGRTIKKPGGNGLAALLRYTEVTPDRVVIQVEAAAPRLYIGDPDAVRDEALRSLPELDPAALSRTSTFPQNGGGYRFALETSGPESVRRLIRLVPLTGVPEEQEGKEMLRIEVLEGVVQVADPNRPGARSTRLKPGEEMDRGFAWVAVTFDGGKLSLSVTTKPGSMIQLSDDWGAEGLASRQDVQFLKERVFHRTAQVQRRAPEPSAALRTVVPATPVARSLEKKPSEAMGCAGILALPLQVLPVEWRQRIFDLLKK